MASSDSGSSDSDTCDRKMGRNSRKSPVILTRPKANPGFWLCTLMPLAFAMRYLRETPATADADDAAPTYKMLTIAAFGMSIESLCFFLYLFWNTNLLLKLVISFIPGLLTSCLFTLILQQSWTFGIFWGFAVTFCYQLVYIRVMRGLPKCFTYGEASILVQGVMLFVLNVLLNTPRLLYGDNGTKGAFEQLSVIMMFALFCLFIVCCLFALVARLRNPLAFYAIMIVLLLAVTLAPITRPLPVIALFNFIVQDQKRLLIIVFYVLLVVLTVAAVWWQLRNSEKASTRVRKIFHLLVILVYLPGMVYQCAFLYIASGVALALISVLELFRVLNIPPFAVTLNKAFGSFSDEKDSGILALTPFCLLIGCSLPMWITPCPCGDPREILPNMAGLLTIGFGDTAASVIGSKIGKIQWRNSTRTLEGSSAYIVAILLPVYVLSSLQLIPMSTELWVYVVGATVVTAFVEARTTQIDNLILPILFYSIVSVV